MLCTKQKVLRRFWYATVPIGKIEDGRSPSCCSAKISCCSSTAMARPLLPPHRKVFQGLVP